MTLKHTHANWAQALADLREAPVKPPGAKSLRQAIDDAIDDVISCRARGHTDSDILAIFARNGIQMSLHTFRQYVRQARRAKTQQVSEGKSKAERVSNAQGPDIRGGAQMRKGEDSREADTTRPEPRVAQRVDAPVAPPTISGARDAAAPISQAVAKPEKQTGKTAAEVLGHRFNEDV
ncbi:MAG: hypothetical protein EKK29_19905 [Hyphomicrobiales bacterium]|nr:MAG: hypothetical protein EKK29_19905 [Hyphomicrobiales bacterium]